MAGTAQVVKDLRAIARLYLEIAAGQGLTVQAQEATGWTTRGRDGTLRPDYVIAHHIAGPDMDGLLIRGRLGVPGPLCNEALHYDGTLVLIASGPANHPGVATVSKYEALGIEASGPQPITAKGSDAFPQYQAYACLIAAHYRYYGWPDGRCLAHKEIARPDGRKPDPAFGSVFPAPYPDMGQFRALARRIESEEEDLTIMDDATKDYLDDQFRLVRIGDTQGGASDSHDFSSIEGVGRKVDKLSVQVNALAVQVAQLVAALPPPPEPPA